MIRLLFYIFILSFTLDSSTIFALNIKAESYFLFDYTTGKTLLSKHPNQKREIASLTKMMTAYVVLKEVELGRITLNDNVRVSFKADATGGSSLGITQNSIITVDALLKGLIVHSGNDAAVALAEHVAKTEAQFVKKMNQMAKQLGMKQTHFENSSGLPSKHPQYSTARDMGILSQAIIHHFPDAYRDIFGQPYYQQYQNRNRLVFKGYADGLKTGYTKKAGYCLVASRKEGETRLISVVLGAHSKRSRVRESKKLLQFGFKNFETVLFYKKNKMIATVPIQDGATKQIAIGVKKPILMTLPKGEAEKITPIFTFKDNQKSIYAPIQKGQIIGYLTFDYAMLKNKKWAIIALKTVKKGNFWSWLTHLLQ